MTSSVRATHHDVILVGGGLANALIAYRLHTLRPDVDWIMLESESALFGGNRHQTWSFHAGDLSGSEHWVTALASMSWPGYRVAFPDLVRTFSGAYFSIKASDLRRTLTSIFGARLSTNALVRHVSADGVVLRDGTAPRARLVVDGRGFANDVPYACGFQKFVGLTVKTAAPHGVCSPVLMDATVDQTEGYRFVYVLPWSERELLIEDTYYSESPRLNDAVVKRRIDAYAAAAGWNIEAVVAEERGVLPIPLAGADIPRATPGVLQSGVGGGRYHATTGYSVAQAVRLADQIATSPSLDSGAADRLNAMARRTWRGQEFFRRLNNMLFLAARPHERWRILQQFYQRDDELITRFYAGRSTRWDRMRMISGRPPVPLDKGLRAFVTKFADERSLLA